jgi:RNA polymerase sigma factor (sigma-70 family)
MSASLPPAVGALPIPAQAVYTVLCALLPADTPRSLTAAEIARVGGLARGHVAASLVALEEAGLIWCSRPAPGRGASIALRTASDVSAPGQADSPAAEEQPQAERPGSRRGRKPRRAQEPSPAPVVTALRDYFRAFPPGTELATSMRELAQEIGRPYTGQISLVLGLFVQAGFVERLPGKALRLRVCATAAVPSEPAFTIHELVVQHLSILSPGAEVLIRTRQIAAQLLCGVSGVVRALQVLESQGLIHRTITRQGTHITILAPLSTSPPPALTPAPARLAPPPSGRPDRPTPHAALWRHLLANGPRLAPIDWLLSGLTVTVWPAATELTCVDAPRAETAHALHEPLVAALRTLELPDALVIVQAPDQVQMPNDSTLLDDALGDPIHALRLPPTVSDEEARALLAQVQAGQAARERREALVHPSADLAAALDQAVAVGHAAWEHLILTHLRLVVRIAQRYPSERVSLEERVQAGALGLMQATAQSDGRLNRPFELLAYGAARNAIRAVLRAGDPIRRPSTSSRVFQAQTQLRAALGRAPTAEEIAVTAGMQVATVLAVLASWAEVASLEAPLREGEEGTLGEVLPDDPTQNPEAVVIAAEEQQSERQTLRAALAKLDPHERRVIILRYGLKGEARSVGEVAAMLGWTVPRVQRVEARALTALRVRLDKGEQAG